MAYDVPAPYAQAVRSGFKLTYTARATRAGAPVWPVALQPTGGTITDTTKPGVRRALSLELASEPGLYDALNVYGTTLTVTAHVTYTDQSSAAIPMGVFDVDQTSVDEGGGKITLTAPDKWVRLTRANFIQWEASSPGQLVTDQITLLVRGALGASEQVNVLTASTARMTALTWDPSQTSRAQAILDIATGAGLWCYFDRDGVFTIADIPQAKANADWVVDASASGVLVSLSRQQDRTHSYNVVVVSSSASGGPLFDDQWAWDNDPTSPTYAGTQPRTNPETAGPFGIVTYHFSTPLDVGTGGAYTTGLTILSKTVGVASQATLGSVPNPAMDSFDALNVVGPQQRYDIPRSVERHIADTVTHQLDVTQPQQIQGRSTRTDAYT